MSNDCPYCGKQHFNFGDDEEGVELRCSRASIKVCAPST